MKLQILVNYCKMKDFLSIKLLFGIGKSLALLNIMKKIYTSEINWQVNSDIIRINILGQCLLLSSLFQYIYIYELTLFIRLEPTNNKQSNLLQLKVSYFDRFATQFSFSQTHSHESFDLLKTLVHHHHHTSSVVQQIVYVSENFSSYLKMKPTLHQSLMKSKQMQ